MPADSASSDRRNAARLMQEPAGNEARYLVQRPVNSKEIAVRNVATGWASD